MKWSENGTGWREFFARGYWTLYLAWHHRGQGRYPFKPLAAILKDQSRRVRSQVTYAQRYVPYYRETMARLGLTPADFKTAADLPKLPIITRHDLQGDPEYFVSTQAPRNEYLKLCTSGSTGEPCTVYHDARSLFLNAAQSRREGALLTALIGKYCGCRHTLVAVQKTAQIKIHAFLRARGFFPRKVTIARQYLDVAAPIAQNLKALKEFKPQILRAYGSYYSLLLKNLPPDEDFPFPQVISYGADTMSPVMRKFITEELGLPILSSYGSIEILKIGFECLEHRGLHHNLDLYPVRLVDSRGREAPPGEKGDVIVSNLLNRGTVLLNYRIGDMASWVPEPCPCGRTLPLLSFPDGRSDDSLLLPSGRIIYCHVLNEIFKGEPDIWQYQTVHQEPRQVELRLVTREGTDHAGLGARMQQQMNELLQSEATVKVVFVDRVERTPAGKVRQVISRCELP